MYIKLYYVLLQALIKHSQSVCLQLHKGKHFILFAISRCIPGIGIVCGVYNNMQYMGCGCLNIDTDRACS